MANGGFPAHADLAFGQFHMGDHTHRMDACIGLSWIRRGDWQGGRNAAKPLQGRSERHALFSEPASLGRPLMVSDHPFEFDYFIVQHRAIYFCCPCKR